MQELKTFKHNRELFIILDIQDMHHVKVVESECETVKFFSYRDAEEFALKNIGTGWMIVRLMSLFKP